MKMVVKPACFMGIYRMVCLKREYTIVYPMYGVLMWKWSLTTKSWGTLLLDETQIQPCSQIPNKCNKDTNRRKTVSHCSIL
jgi:hypothetical protein